MPKSRSSQPWSRNLDKSGQKTADRGLDFG